jgi:hypothetical protein
MSIPVVTPAEVHTLPSTTKIASRSTAAPGTSFASRSHADQCVAQRRPSSNPAKPITNAPEHTEPIRRTTSAARCSHARTRRSRTTAVIASSSPPTTSTVSVSRGRTDASFTVVIDVPAVVARSPPRLDAKTTSYARLPSWRFVAVNTSAGPIASRLCAWSKTTKITRGAIGRN